MSTTGFVSIHKPREHPIILCGQRMTNMTCREILLKMIKDQHSLFQMESRDRPNLLTRVLVSLYELGASDEHLTRAYQQLAPDLTTFRVSTLVKLNEENWQDYLGDHSCYGDFLAFFDKQVELLGIETVLERYFYTSVLQQSIGSQLQPLVHLAFGMEQGLSLVVTQALAYLACTFLDASDLTCTADPLASTTGNQDVHVLFDMVAADQRFDGRFDGGNTLYSAVKVLLKSKSELLRTYMTEWAAIAKNDISQQHGLFLLAELAAKLIRQSSSCSSGQIELDEFLGGGQLLASALAIHTIINHCPQHIELDVNSLVNLQFLSMLCTYVVQGRPKPYRAAPNTPIPSSSPVDWSDCASAIIESGDPKAILALRSLKQAWQCDKNDIYRDTAKFLVDFVHDGIWVKGGIGWKP